MSSTVQEFAVTGMDLSGEDDVTVHACFELRDVGVNMRPSEDVQWVLTSAWVGENEISPELTDDQIAELATEARWREEINRELDEEAFLGFREEEEI